MCVCVCVCVCVGGHIFSKHFFLFGLFDRFFFLLLLNWHTTNMGIVQSGRDIHVRNFQRNSLRTGPKRGRTEQKKKDRYSEVFFPGGEMAWL